MSWKSLEKASLGPHTGDQALITAVSSPPPHQRSEGGTWGVSPQGGAGSCPSLAKRGPHRATWTHSKSVSESRGQNSKGGERERKREYVWWAREGDSQPARPVSQVPCLIPSWGTWEINSGAQFAGTIGFICSVNKTQWRSTRSVCVTPFQTHSRWAPPVYKVQEESAKCGVPPRPFQGQQGKNVQGRFTLSEAMGGLMNFIGASTSPRVRVSKCELYTSVQMAPGFLWLIMP